MVLWIKWAWLSSSQPRMSLSPHCPSMCAGGGLHSTVVSGELKLHSSSLPTDRRFKRSQIGATRLLMTQLGKSYIVTSTTSKPVLSQKEETYRNVNIGRWGLSGCHLWRVVTIIQKIGTSDPWTNDDFRLWQLLCLHMKVNSWGQL